MSEESNPATPEQLNFFRSLCREHAPQWEHLWFELFDNKGCKHHQHQLAPSIDEPGDISYNPCRGDSKRVRSTLGKFMTKMFGMSIRKEEEVWIGRITADMVTNLIGREGVKEEFTILQGREIVQAFVDQIGGHSCMTGVYGNSSTNPRIKNIQQWYGRWGEKLRMLVWKKTQGRALYWLGDDGKQYVDRMYGVGALGACRFQEWAQLHKAQLVYGTNVKALVTLGPEALQVWFPYLDSFKYVSESGQFATDQSLLKCSFIFNITDGSLQRSRVFRCIDCDTVVNARSEGVTELPSGQKLCRLCRDAYTRCNCCQEWVRRDGDVHCFDGLVFCAICYKDHTHSCQLCRKRWYNTPLEMSDGRWRSTRPGSGRITEELIHTFRRPEVQRLAEAAGVQFPVLGGLAAAIEDNPHQQIAPPPPPPRPTLTPTPLEGDPICPRCIEREFERCSGCGKNRRKNTLTKTGEGLCNYYTCEDCSLKATELLQAQKDKTAEMLKKASGYYSGSTSSYTTKFFQ